MPFGKHQKRREITRLCDCGYFTVVINNAKMKTIQSLLSAVHSFVFCVVLFSCNNMINIFPGSKNILWTVGAPTGLQGLLVRLVV